MEATDRRSPARVTLTVIGLVLLTLLALGLVYVAHRALIWIVVAAFFATAITPAVNWTQRRMAWCKRWLATLLVFLVISVALAGLVAAFVVPLAREATQFADSLPGIVRDAREGRGPIGGLIERFRLREYAEQHSGQIRDYLSNLTAPTFAFLRGAATTVAGIVTVFVLAYLMVLEAPRIVDGFLALFPTRRAERIRAVGSDCARTVTGYISGNLLISAICGGLTYVVLLVMDVPFAGLVALFVAISDLIPLVGATLGAIVAVGAGFLTSPRAGIVVLVFFIAYQQVENHLLQPVIYSRTVKLNPLTALIAILLGVELAGILGALLAIPIAGMIQVIARDVWRDRRARTDPTTAARTDPAIAARTDPATAALAGTAGPAVTAGTTRTTGTGSAGTEGPAGIEGTAGMAAELASGERAGRDDAAERLRESSHVRPTQSS